jgi:hypothetical protein
MAAGSRCWRWRRSPGGPSSRPCIAAAAHGGFQLVQPLRSVTALVMPLPGRAAPFVVIVILTAANLFQNFRSGRCTGSRWWLL